MCYDYQTSDSINRIFPLVRYVCKYHKLVKDGIKVTQLIQVCYDVEYYDTRKREVDALLRASEELGCKRLLVITEDYEGTERFEDRKINFIPLWKWLINTKISYF